MGVPAALRVRSYIYSGVGVDVATDLVAGPTVGNEPMPYTEKYQTSRICLDMRAGSVSVWDAALAGLLLNLAIEEGLSKNIAEIGVDLKFP